VDSSPGQKSRWRHLHENGPAFTSGNPPQNRLRKASVHNVEMGVDVDTNGP